MSEEARALVTWVAVACAAALAVVTLRTWWRVVARRRALRARAERGRDGEDRAAVLLERRGYRVLARQSAVSWNVHVDGRAVPIALRADYVVTDERRRFVAEVKTGRLAPRIESSATRRQLLEYRFAFDVDGVLLVDAEADAIHEIVFAEPPLRAEPRAAPRARWIALAFVVGAAASAVITRALGG